MRSDKKRSWWCRHSLSLLIASLVAVSLIAVVAAFAVRPHKGAEAWVCIPRDATSASVTDSLKSALGSVEGNRVAMLWRLAGGTAQRAHGAYKVTDGQSAVTTAWRMAKGRQTPVRVTWNNVRTLRQLAEKLAARLECTPGEFMLACDSVLPSMGYEPLQFTAAFIPDTYEFYWNSSPAHVVGVMAETARKFWSKRAEALEASALTPVQAATLASIVEEETSGPDEYGKIARLYLNRLERGMPLQADPTVKYAVGDFALRRITRAHLSVESPYNTYRHKGLPPGPIRVASPAAIDKVLSAPRHDYIYMCADAGFSGHHNFASDYATHMANARRYQAELNRRGIK